MQRYIINQTINNQLISKISVMSNDEDIEALKSILLLPKKGELIERFYTCKLQLQDKDKMKTYISVAMPSCNFSGINGYESVLIGRYYNLRVHSISLFAGQDNTWSYKTYINSIRKGKRYEIYISQLLKLRGYKIIHNCLELEKLDKGIDFISVKDDTVLFIQCKNFENTEITHIHLKEFYANCELYLLKNPFDGLKKRFMYISSKNFLSDSARYFLNENSFIEYSVIPLKK